MFDMIFALIINISLLSFDNYTRTPHFAVKALGGRLVSVDELMMSSDFVVVAAALNEDTRFIVNRDRIASMKPNAILVNIGRGG